MIVLCPNCDIYFDDAYRLTACPHDTFVANDGDNNFAHHPESYLSEDAPGVRRHRMRRLSRMRRDYAREYWEAAALSASLGGAEPRAQHADRMLAEWRKRWCDDGSEQPSESVRRTDSPHDVQ